MLKHSEILEGLKPLQKVALVTSALESESLAQAGLAPTGRASLGELGAHSGVPFESAARSWDVGLVKEATKELVAEAAADGARLFVTPDLKAAVDPASAALSEDPCLNGELGGAMVGAIHEAGAAAGLSKLSLTREQAACLDRRENKEAIFTLVSKPFLIAAKGEPEAVFASAGRIGSGYPDTNRMLFRDALGGYYGKDAFVVGEDTVPNAEAISLLHGRVCLGGAKMPLERASRRYIQLKKYCSEGSMTERDLEDALRAGTALSEEKLDEAADEVIDFCERLGAYTPIEPCGEENRARLASDCIVLLRNNKLLPLEKGKRLAVIGEAYADLSALEERFHVVGRAPGYERDSDRSDDLIPEAVRIAGEADAALLFLYPGEHGTQLPANRMALLAAVERTGTPVIALVCGERAVDMAFDTSLNATLMVPSDGKYAGEALARVLSGEVSPSGKLTRTAYDDAEGYFAALNREKAEGRVRIGPFVGYRRCDAAEEDVRYPFGFGLSYTQFAYSKLTVRGDEISFTLKNTGKCDGAEVVQIYIGAPSETRVMPVKELRAFRKIFLRAGESQTVTFTLPASSYATFDPRTFTETVETGMYTVYVCSSSQDVRLHGRRALTGVEREPTDEHKTEYFPDSEHHDVATVKQEGRVSEVNVPPKGLRIARKASVFLLPILGIAFFLLLSIFLLSEMFDYILFFTIDETMVEWVLCVISVAVIAIVPLAGALNRRRLARTKTICLTACPFLLFACLILGYLLMAENGDDLEHAALVVLGCLTVGAPLAAIVSAVVEATLKKSKFNADRWAKYYYVPVQEETVTADTVFEEAFRVADTQKEAEKAKAAPREEEPLPIAEVPQFYDKYLTYEVMLRDCRQFAADRGVVADEATMRNLIAALSSTQLLIVPHGGGAELVRAVAEYFGRKAYIDSAEEYRETEDLFSHWKQSERCSVRTNFSDAIDAARKESAFMHTVLLRHMPLARLEQVLSPVIDVCAKRKTSIFLPDEGEILLPQNLFIVTELDEQDTAGLPASVAEIAAVLDPEIEQQEAAPKKSVVQSVGFERFAALRQTVRDDYPLSEASWKSVDRLDEKCRAAHIGNFLWLKMERHASVVLACGGTEAAAVAGALDVELYPWLNGTWNEEICGMPLSDVLLDIFGSKREPSKEAPKTRGKKTKQ